MIPRLYLIGNLESRRTRFFVESVKRFEFKWQIVSWERLLSGADEWVQGIEDGSSIRLDSPGQNFAVEKALLRWGIDERETRFTRISAQQLEKLPYEKGRVLALDQWYAGWQKVLKYLEASLRGRSVSYFNPPSDVGAMFDKPRCNRLLNESGVPVPPVFGSPGDFDELVEMMRLGHCRRIFLKPCYSSSASGIVALEIQAGRHQAFSSVEMVRGDGEIKLFNSRHVKRYEGLAEIRELVDAICRENAYVERWLPKAGLGGKRFDLRIVVVAGIARHVVVRLSDHPMTNLHLGAKRGEVGRLREAMGEPAWASVIATAEKAMRSFPDSLYGGIDLLVSPGWKKPHVLEVNAFGDFLPGYLWQGLDTFTCELKAWAGRSQRRDQVSTTGL